ncbi:MAG: hypothetical protein AMJ46_10520 [Latescibacteria bacterium DG_63]|nr:MAG: hypothetical protein AMJ46_10520 [Latescibacteria bacterium DG_63]
MFRYMLAGALLLLMAVPAGATVYPSGGTNPQAITITLEIPCYTNVQWNNDADKNIVFNNTVGSTGDWYRQTDSTETGLYVDNSGYGKSSQDAYTEGYYESFDGALFWLQSNCNAQMTLTSNGNLLNGTAELPTWYTVALTNNTGCTCHSDCGFINGGVRMSDGDIPLDCEGCYADDANSDNVMELFGGAFYPIQKAFPMESGGNTVYTGNFTAFAEGTIKFQARALRSGISDLAGTYTTTLSVNFVNP